MSPVRRRVYWTAPCLTFFPLYTAVATAAAVLAMFFQLYLMAVVMAL